MAKKNENPGSKIAVVILQYFIIAACIFFALISAGEGLYYYMKISPIFKIREVVSDQSLQFIRTRTLDRLIGQSIFDVDLYAVGRRLQVEYPQIDHLRIFRQFPNRIYVDAVRRDPFAVIVSRKQPVLIDKDGIVLALNIPANHRLPLVTGIVSEQSALVGKPLRGTDLLLAITIIKSVKENPHLESMPITDLDLTNLSQIQCVLANGMKIILEEEKVQQKIAMLGIVVSQGKIKPEELNYIDLRFKEPIINKKLKEIPRFNKIEMF